MKTNEEELIRLSDIVDAMQEIQAYVGSADYGDFAMREDMKEAVISQLQQVGGAAALLSDEFKEKYRDIDWDILKGLQYSNYDQQYELDMSPHWYIITNDFPDLLPRLSDIVMELQTANDLEDEIMLDDTDETAGEIEARVENETYLNQRFNEDQLVGDLESEQDIEKDLRDKHLPLDIDDNIAGLTAKDRKMLRQVNRETEATQEGDLEFESLDDMDINSVDQADDSFIDQRYEDVNLMEDSSLDDGLAGDEESGRERG